MVLGGLGPPGREEVRKSGPRAGVRMPRVLGMEAGGGGPPVPSGLRHFSEAESLAPGPARGGQDVLRWFGRDSDGQGAPDARRRPPILGIVFLPGTGRLGPSPAPTSLLDPRGGRQVAFLPRGLRVRLRGRPFHLFRHAVASRRCVILPWEFVPVRVLPPGGFAVTGAE